CSDIQIFDGLDVAYWKFEEDDPLDSVVPKTFTFTSAPFDRTAELTLFVASVAPNRPNQLDITVGGSTTTLNNVLNDLDGPEWSSLTLPVDVPAGATSVTVEPISPEIAVPVELGGAASIVWVAGAFSIPKPGEIGDTVFCDFNGNGIQDGAEPGLDNVTVNLVCRDDTGNTVAQASAQTSNGGKYLFIDLPPGACTVTVDENTLPADCNEPVPGCPPERQVDLAPGESYLDADFCFAPPPDLGRIGDTVFCDLNRNGIQDPGEAGIDGVRVSLFCFDAGGLTFGGSMVTSNGGVYLFEDLLPGLCIVTVDETTLPDDCRQRVPDCPTSYQIDLGPGDSILTADFCFAPPLRSSIGDTVFCDLNGDGNQDPGEEGLEGVTVDLQCVTASGQFVSLSTTTDADGKYLFAGLEDGNCLVTVNVSTAPSSCPDPSPGCPTRYTVTLAAGESFLDADFCFTVPGCPLDLQAFCAIPEAPPSGNDCDDGGKPVEITLVYTAEDCSFTNNPQEGASECTDLGALPTDAYILVTNKEDPFDGGAKIWFSDPVSESGTFVMKASNGGKDKFDSNSYIHVFDGPGGALKQTVKFHTSCSKPLSVGDQFGAGLIIEMVFDSGRTVTLPDSQPDLRKKCTVTLQPGVICPDGDDIFALDLVYTAEDCTNLFHSQDSGKVECADFGPMPLPDDVYIIVTDEDKVSDVLDGKGKIWFEGNVSVNDPFTASAANAGDDKLSSSTFIYVFDSEGGNLRQAIEFHTSCSQPLQTGDQFGGIVIFGADTKDAGT
ncbi:MAG: hypothetical protein HKO57_14275, partial [Akkermansiaceae bacterium]|nr:hypothetical protein [Akkermansiaceae bacterium]